LTGGGDHAYGEGTAPTLWKIWKVIGDYVFLRRTDVVGDWGAGAGKMLFSKQFFCTLPDMCAIGFEIHRPTYDRAVLNKKMLGEKLTNTQIVCDNSSTMVHWNPVSIMLAYDGSTVNFLDDEHFSIMKAIFRTATMRCVFSTKLNMSLFLDYFDRPTERIVDITDWRLITMTGMKWEGSKYIGNLWIRLSTRH
jgi:hypothetical protein